jgi:hypothetical protein
VGFHATSKPTADTIMAVELCISDVVKPLLLANPSFIPYVVDALLLVRTQTALLYLRFHVSRVCCMTLTCCHLTCHLPAYL